MAGDEGDLFRRTIGSVQPLRNRPRKADIGASPVKKSAAVQPSTRQRHQDSLKLGDAPIHLAQGQQRRQLRRLAGERFVAQDQIDLHGCTVEQARSRLLEFIESCGRAGHTRVRIIHGKGYRSRDKYPALKNLVDALLREQSQVLAYRPAGKTDGGAGAVRVLLKRA